MDGFPVDCVSVDDLPDSKCSKKQPVHLCLVYSLRQVDGFSFIKVSSIAHGLHLTFVATYPLDTLTKLLNKTICFYIRSG
jgi:hypothetical protein